MSKKILSNAFSLNMLNVKEQLILKVSRISAAEIPTDAESSVGHQDIASVISSILGREVAMDRRNDTLENGDVLYVAQYRGPRLPEGAINLPEDATIEFYRMDVIEG